MDFDGRKHIRITGILNPAALAVCLAPLHYWLSYDTKTGTAKLEVNPLNRGGQTILEFTCEYEVAARLAADLGLTAKGESSPTHWSWYNDCLHLEHNGSQIAEALLKEIRLAEIPHTLVQVESSKPCRLKHGNYVWTEGQNTSDEMRRKVHEVSASVARTRVRPGISP